MKSKPLIIFLCLVISIFFFLLFRSVSLNPAYAIPSIFSSPRAFVYEVVYGTKNVDTDNLKEENRRLREAILDYEMLKKDNEALRSQFEELTLPSSSLIPARVVGFKGAPQTPHTFVLDQGSESGVVSGASVVVGKQLVGEITTVAPYFSHVMLVAHKDFTTLAQTLENNAPGIIKGFDEFIVFDHVVITDVIKNADTVITKGEQDASGVGILPGLIIGKIDKVNKSETQPFQSATVESLLDFNSLTTVFIATQ